MKRRISFFLILLLLLPVLPARAFAEDALTWKLQGSVLTIEVFESRDGVARTAFASVSGQGHECREHTCEYAWRFLSRFTK